MLNSKPLLQDPIMKKKSYRVSSQLLKYENSEYHLIASDIVQTGQKEHRNETSFSHPTGFTQYTSIGAQMVASNRLTIRTGTGSQMKVYTFIVENKI